MSREAINAVRSNYTALPPSPFLTCLATNPPSLYEPSKEEKERN